jgi:alanyl-tRNA synthetase
MTLRNFVCCPCLISDNCSLTHDYLELGNIAAEVKAIFHEKRFFQSTSAIPEGVVFGVILDRTNFYAEAGGQEYDTGSIVIDSEVSDKASAFEVTNVQVYNGYVLHIGRLKYGRLDVGSKVLSSYDEVRSICYSRIIH